MRDPITHKEYSCPGCGKMTSGSLSKYGEKRALCQECQDKADGCPYCQTELVKRDTTALGGDESFNWCPDCERVIEDGERMVQ